MIWKHLFRGWHALTRREALKAFWVLFLAVATEACGGDPTGLEEPDPGSGDGGGGGDGGGAGGGGVSKLTVTDDFEDGELDGWFVQLGSPSIAGGDVGSSTFAVVHRTAETFSADQYSEILLGSDFDLETPGSRWNGAAVSVRYRESDNARFNPIGGRPADGPADGGLGWKGRWTLKLDGVIASNTEYFAVRDRQHVRPTSEEQNPGGWTAEGGPVNTFDCVNDPAQDLSDASDFNSTTVVAANVDPDDDVYILSPPDPASALVRFGCTLFADRVGSTVGTAPGTTKQHRLRIRHRRQGGDRTVSLAWRVMQGSSIIEAGSVTGIGDDVSETTVWLAMTSVNSITDYSDLSIEIEADATGGSSASRVRVAYVELDIPDVLPVAGDRIRAEVRGSGASMVVSVIKNGALLLSGSPTGSTGAGFVDGAGAPGFPMSPPEGTYKTYAASWEGGDL